ncbi:hypothetical protein GCM10011515_02970 [Tsuneonella deserti]|uniref:Uncharacterized protein n=1 Tax=Tsuneonella deserti TaxID=2035528 RepID=A0ABQ1S040_9SPHN|nr:hypothetical protein [Tsuneonella deserti]GGD86892.1 hypothetical protein GCM10011515_02970 [Tsuneonella deserti]
MTFDYRARQHGRAIYLVAGQEGLHALPRKPASAIRGGELPAGLASPADLDFLDPANPFFVTDRALFSFGQFLGRKTPPGIFDKRPGITILGDSGGFQLIDKPALWNGEATCAEALAWLEKHADEAMTLDIPTGAIGCNPLFPDFASCLTTTMTNNAYFHANAAGQTRFLTVVQGRNRKEVLAWYDAVKTQPFDGGWALGGGTRSDYVLLTELLHAMIQDGLLGCRNRLHVLGTSTLTQSVMLSALQRSVRALPGQAEFQITFDTANPSLKMVFGQLVGHPLITPDASGRPGEFRDRTFKTPTHSDFSPDDRRALPIKCSRIAERLTIGDLCARPGIGKNSPWDDLARALVTHHNVDATLRAIDEANSIMELPTHLAVQVAPVHVVRSYQALLTAFRHSNPVAHVRREANSFAKL